MSLIICSSTQDEYLRKNRSGDVISSKDGKEFILKSVRQKSGYLIVNLFRNKNRKVELIQKIVMEHFGPEKPGVKYVITHIDDDLSNNNISNLKWIPISEVKYGAKPKPIQAFDIITDDIFEFKTSTDAASFLTTSIINLKSCVINNSLLKNRYRVEYI